MSIGGGGGGGLTKGQPVFFFLFLMLLAGAGKDTVQRCKYTGRACLPLCSYLCHFTIDMAQPGLCFLS